MNDYATLLEILHRFADESKVRPFTLGEALDSLDGEAYAFITIILALPFLQPIPLGPLTVIGGLAFATIGWQLLHGHTTPVLPVKLRQVTMSEKTWRILIKVCIKIMWVCHKFAKPRLPQLISGPRGKMLGGGIVLAAGALMAIPFGVLPFNNTLPALAILFYGVGELEDDGLMIIIACLWLVATVVYFSAFFTALWLFGSSALSHLVN